MAEPFWSGWRKGREETGRGQYGRGRSSGSSPGAAAAAAAGAAATLPSRQRLNCRGHLGRATAHSRPKHSTAAPRLPAYGAANRKAEVLQATPPPLRKSSPPNMGITRATIMPATLMVRGNKFLKAFVSASSCYRHQRR
eukprot:359793-Chlamydomonas_euryale.AAC.15